MSIDFNEPYNKDACVKFFQDDFLPDDFSPGQEEIDLFFNPTYIKHVTFLGDSPSLGLKVYHISHDSPHDPRVSITKETFRLMKEYNDFHVLAFFTSPASGNYRLSYVTIGLTADDRKIKYEYSNPRRYSYFLGPDARVHTPSRFLIKKGRISDINDLQERFSVEVVNKEFYKRIATLFTKLVGGQRKEGSKTSEYKEILKLPVIKDHKKMQEFAVRMIGRIVFCWFLKKKATPNGDALIPGEVLSLDAVKEYKNYYHNVLEKLFFQVLNTPKKERREEFKTGPFTDIPFLNGGLFEPHQDDFYELNEFPGTSKYDNTLIVPDTWLEELFTLLEEYNFTIDENTAMDVELSVDPEMLGRIFENLLAEINPETGETARKSTGSYYTPRPIVEYMVDESLKQYLVTKTGLNEEKLAGVLSYSLDGEDLSEEEKEKIINALDEVKIIDPACGSGAFPMGILQKMVLILQKVDPDSVNWIIKQLDRIPDQDVRNIVEEQLMKENWNYIRKQGIIRNSIYGVDIQQIAVEISKLRVFLSLVVDSKIDDTQDNRGIKPLPNLEFKFVCANTLIGLPAGTGESGGLYEATAEIKKLKSLRESYFSSYGYRKHQIEKEFKEIQDKMIKHSLEMVSMGEQTMALSAWDPFSDKASDWFDPEWMFGIKSGFDIIISNPPYIRQEMLGELKEYFKRNYDVYSGVADIYVYFIEKGMNLLKANGIYCIIVANKWLRAKYGKPLRKFLKQKQLVKLVDFRDLPIFEATTYPCILMAAKSTPEEYFDVYNVEKLDLTNLYNHLQSIKFKSKQDYLNDSHWDLAEERIQLLKLKLISIGVTLEKYVDGKVYYGIKTGYNKAFVIDEATKNMLISEDPKSAELIKPFLAGRDVKRYNNLQTNKFLILIPNSWTREHLKVKKHPWDWFKNSSPSIAHHLAKYKNDAKKRYDKGEYWWELRACGYYSEFEKPKIIYPNICKKPEFTFDKEGLFTNQKCFIIPGDHKYLLGILNSKISFFLFKRILPKLRGDFFEPGYEYLKDFPIPRLELSNPGEKSQYERMEELVGHMLVFHEQYQSAAFEEEKNKIEEKIKHLDGEIDRLVYELYQLTPEEIAIIEGEIKK